MVQEDLSRPNSLQWKYYVYFYEDFCMYWSRVYVVYIIMCVHVCVCVYMRARVCLCFSGVNLVWNLGVVDSEKKFDF